jgi:hypothetical protein
VHLASDSSSGLNPAEYAKHSKQTVLCCLRSIGGTLQHTVQLHVAACTIGKQLNCPAHAWQNSAQGRSASPFRSCDCQMASCQTQVMIRFFALRRMETCIVHSGFLPTCSRRQKRSTGNSKTRGEAKWSRERAAYVIAPKAIWSLLIAGHNVKSRSFAVAAIV